MEEEVRVKSGEGVGRSKAPRKNTAMHFRMSPTGWCHTYCLALTIGALQVVTEIRACLMLHPQARGQPCCPSHQAPPTQGPCSRLPPSAFRLPPSSAFLLFAEGSAFLGGEVGFGLLWPATSSWRAFKINRCARVS